MSEGVIEYTEAARLELDALFFWISIETGPNAAQAVMRHLNRAIQNVAAFPLMGQMRPEWVGEPRSLSVHPWLLLYEPLERRRGIRLLRVLDSRQNLDAILGRDP